MKPMLIRRFPLMRVAVAIGISLGIALTASTAFAHPGHGLDSNDLQSGLLHPLLGIDHWMAIVFVGIAAFSFSRRETWRLPLIYCLSMMMAAVVGNQYGSIVGNEAWACLAVVALGAGIPLVGRSTERSWWPLVLATGLLQGLAHGSETAGAIAPAPYLMGLLGATAVLLVLGVGLAIAARRMEFHTGLLKTSGALTALSAIAVLVGWI